MGTMVSPKSANTDSDRGATEAEALTPAAQEGAHHCESEMKLRLTNTLLRAVSTGDPVRSLVVELASICHGSAVVYDPEGAVIECAGEAPAQLIWNEIEASNAYDHQLLIGRWTVMTRRVAISAETHVIAIASRTPALVQQPGVLILDTAERLLSTINGLQFSSHLRERRDIQRILSTLQDGIPPSREHLFWHKLSKFHIPSYVPMVAFEIAPKDSSPANENHIEKLVHTARQHGFQLLVGLSRLDARDSATMTGIAPSGRVFQDFIAAQTAQYSCGVSSPFHTLVKVPEAKREAELALGIAARRSHSSVSGKVVHMDQIDLATWLLSRANQALLQRYVQRTLGPLIDDQEMRKFLSTYLATGQNVRLTADRLFVHQNTVLSLIHI